MIIQIQSLKWYRDLLDRILEGRLVAQRDCCCEKGSQIYIRVCDRACMGKQVLSTQNTLVYIMMYIFCSVAMCYPNSVSFIEFLMDFCTYDDILDTIPITDKKLLHFKPSKSGQILRVDKTCFPRPGHILRQHQKSYELVGINLMGYTALFSVQG